MYLLHLLHCNLTEFRDRMKMEKSIEVGKPSEDMDILSPGSMLNTKIMEGNSELQL